MKYFGCILKYGLVTTETISEEVLRRVISRWELYEYLREVHEGDCGHRHRDAMLSHPKVVDVHWDSKKADCLWICNNCEECILMSKSQPQVVVKPTFVSKPLEKVQVDATSLAADNFGNVGHFVAVDCYSKMANSEGPFPLLSYIYVLNENLWQFSWIRKPTKSSHF